MNILNENNISDGLFVKTNAWTKDKKFIYLKIVKAQKYYKFLCILPKASIRMLLNNYVNRFEWDFYLKCLHRYDVNDKLDKTCNFLQKNSLVKNLKTDKKKRGKPKKRSRNILVNFLDEKNRMNDWIIVNKNEYNRHCMKYKIQKFIYFMYKNKFHLNDDIYHFIYKFIV